MQEKVVDLIAGKSVEADLNEHIVLSEVGTDQDHNLWNDSNDRKESTLHAIIS